MTYPFQHCQLSPFARGITHGNLDDAVAVVAWFVIIVAIHLYTLIIYDSIMIAYMIFGRNMDVDHFSLLFLVYL